MPYLDGIAAVGWFDSTRSSYQAFALRDDCGGRAEDNMLKPACDSRFFQARRDWDVH